VRVTTAFSRLLRLKGVSISDVRFEPDRVVVDVVLRRRRLVCPLCEHSTRARKDTRPVDTVWRHLDLATWRLEVRCRRRRLSCPEHGVRAEGVPFARHGSEFTRDFECLVAWLATRADKSTVRRLVRIDWDTVGRIVARVCADELDPGRLEGLFDIGIDEVSWRRQHSYLTLVVDHQRRCVVWGTDGAGAEAADRFFAELDPELSADHLSPDPEPADIQAQPEPPGPATDVEGRQQRVGERACELRAISMDMGPGYAKSAREHAPGAIVCIDPYHVVQLANKALDEVRRAYWNELHQLGDQEAAKRFKDARWSLLKAPENLTDKQAATLKRLKAAGGEAWRGYTLKEATRAIFGHGLALEDVTVLIDRLLSRLSRSRLDPFVRLGRRSASTAPGSSPRSVSGSTKAAQKRSTTRSA
jgi:transposase